MRKLLMLLKVALNVNFGISSIKYKFRKEKSKRWEVILTVFGIVIGGGSMLALYIFLLEGLFSASSYLGMPQLLLTLAFIASQFIVFVFGIFYIMGSLYFSKDVNTLIPLPFKPYQVLGAKFGVIIANEYLTILPLLIPAFVVFGTGTGQGLFYWLKASVLALLAPIPPLALSAVLIIVLMRFINIRKSKDLFAIIGGILAFASAAVINLFTSRISSTANGDFLKKILADNTAIVNSIGNKFPPAQWASNALSLKGADGTFHFFAFIGICILLLFVLYFLGNAILYKAILAGQETSRAKSRQRKNKNMSSAVNSIFTRASGITKALYWREWKILLRTPVFAMNGLAGIIMGPFMIVITFFAAGSDPDAKFIVKAINDPSLFVPVTLGALGFLLFVAGMNIAASTSLSREGSTFWISKMIPVSGRRQVEAKFLQTLSISLMGIITTTILMSIFIGLPFIQLFSIVLLSITGMVP
ncbi:MAG: hypothetical protein Q7J78_00210, partial [Clostridiales bacterium]|nr:hypothetical protein [Clostridiales bacterium]